MKAKDAEATVAYHRKLEARAAAKERAAIVAWLRDGRMPCDVNNCSCPAALASAISSGEHLSGEKKT